ncbi:MAG: hypothetical protein A3G33_02415 [Omnitrophica bacterium RIFCSPLOWO2_12_FULL_44_17]|uniref:Uncharacterized protein n=1 Tax=Candidatus Danuiimicrobium aquiferis TaxID=1801832 RepID=A0A1G1KW01_9BACT|nr:MAG: hypothetical protein A3B72_00305 [Omnitrophica bacterium RIFCSPHIGHO2_02_FULL_45_28]OGW97118.1 MAG: hypothetical protein A3G33_02415 [Omnitrophica bacterium RIFCSPLOWO2_12_FULL_44_17]OGX03890.1 MAG: hypothetical protein A3J12_02400 [Omnitrophica bacterium RIFCSPLOWO2_02_FULL_44_11]
MKKFLVVFFLFASIFIYFTQYASAELSYLYEYDRSGNLVNKFGATASDEEVIFHVQVGPDDNVYYSKIDSTMPWPNTVGQVMRYTPIGEFQGLINTGDLWHPNTFDFDSNGDLYISGLNKGGEGVISKYSSSGNYLFSFGQMK